MRKKALTKDERKIQIINWFSIRIQHDNEECATVHEVARGLGLSPSHKLRLIMNSMVDDGTLERNERHKSGRYDGWCYKLKEGTFQRPPKQQRTLRINSAKGTQLEMFS